VCFEDGPLCEDLRTKGLRVHIVPFAKEFTRVPRRPSACEFARMLLVIPSVIHDWGKIYALIRRGGYSAIISNSLKSLFVTRPCSFALGVPHIHFLHVDLAKGYGPKPMASFLFWLMRSCHGVLCVSSATRAAFLALGGDHQRAVVVRQSIIFPPQTSRNYAGSRLVIGTLSRIHRAKNIEQIVEALAMLHRRGVDAELRIVGESLTDADQAYKKQLEEQVSARDLAQSVRFVGFKEDIWPILADLDVFVSTSRNESFGRSVVEAMGMALPVVVTPVGGLAENVRDGETGLWTRLDDPAHLADILARLAGSPVERMRLGQAASAWVRPRYSQEEYRKAVTSVIDRVTSG
jgi:glycosyltransferase involved in cell wall biosynthesis